MNSALRTIIIDDEERAILNLVSLLKSFPQIKVVAQEKGSAKALETIDNYVH